MSDTILKIECGPPGIDGRRVVVAKLGKKSHRDKFDPSDSFKREKFRLKVISAFSLDESAHEFLEEKIITAADSQATEELVQCSTVRLSDVQPEEVQWLWRERIAIGKLTLIVGDPGLGKSFFTLDIAARVSRGGITLFYRRF